MRFITQIVTPFYSPEIASADFGVTNIVSQAAANTSLEGQQKVIYG